MNKYTGKSVFGGIAIGKIMVYEKGEHQVKRVKVTDAEAEKNRYYEAVEIAFKQLGELHDKALREVGEANAAIFEIHQMMLEDDDYKESVEHIIESQMVNAEYAIAQTGDNFSQMFAAMDDEYMRGRAADDDDKIRLNQRKPSKYKGLRRFGPEKNLQRINKFMKERPIFYKNLIQMKENIRFYLRCFYCITKVVILQFNSENRTELARNG